MAAMAIVMTPEELDARIDRALEPLRLEIERLRGVAGPELVTTAEAARRLGVTARAVQRWAKDGRVETEFVGGVRLVRLKPDSPQG